MSANAPSGFQGTIAGKALRILSLAQTVSIPTASTLSPDQAKRRLPPGNVSPLASLLGSLEGFRYWLDLTIPPAILPQVIYPSYDEYLGQTSEQIVLRTRAYWPSFVTPPFSLMPSVYQCAYTELTFGEAGGAHGSSLEDYAFLGTLRFILDGIIGTVQGSSGSFSATTFPVPNTAPMADGAVGLATTPWSSDMFYYGLPTIQATYGDVTNFLWAASNAAGSGYASTEVFAIACFTHPSDAEIPTTDPFQAGSTLVNLWNSSRKTLLRGLSPDAYKDLISATTQTSVPDSMVMPVLNYEVELTGLFNRIFVPSIPVEFGGSLYGVPIARVEFEGQLVRAGGGSSSTSVRK